jgi:hypothetical protein
MILAAVLCCLVGIAPCHADTDVASTIQNHLTLDVINLQYLDGKGNKTGLGTAWKLKDYAPFSVRGDLLLYTNYATDFKYGGGVSVVVKSNTVSPKLGIGYLEGPTLYLGLTVIGASATTATNYADELRLEEQPKLDLLLYTNGGAGVLYHTKF